MNREWDLSLLYQGMGDPKLKEDDAALRRSVDEYIAFTETMDEADRGATIKRALQLQERIAELCTPLLDYASLRYSVNTADGEAIDMADRVEKLLSDCSAADARVQSYIGRTEALDALIAEDGFLQEYDFLLHEKKQMARYTLDEKVELALAKMSLSGGRAWERLQDYLTSTAEGEFRGETKSLTELRNLAYDADPAVRKDAYDAEVACYDRIKDGVCFALNSIKQQVTTECELRGGGSPLEMTLRASRMERRSLDALLQAVEEYLPVFWRYLRAKAKALGYEGGLKWWDLFAPMGKRSGSFTVEDVKRYLLDHFRSFAPDMAEMMERAFDEAWIDFFPRQGKTGGAFCEHVPSIKQSRVLANLDGVFDDVVTLAHELGHAYHDRMIEDLRPLNMDYTMPVAETASTFNETVIMNAAIAEATDPEIKLGLVETQLQDTTQIMCDILSRYWFETAVFEKAETGFAFPDELCKLMREAQLRGYGDGVDPETLNPYMWICKSHYYSPEMSFYNFPYAFGGLFAAGLYAQYRLEGDAFLPKYRALLRATGTASCEDVARMAGIDLGDPDFWRSSLEIFKERIELFLSLVGD